MKNTLMFSLMGLFLMFYNANITSTENMPNPITTLQDSIALKIQKWQKLIKINLATIKKKGAKIEEVRKYEKLENTIEAKLSKYPNHYFHFNKDGKCILLYIGQCQLTGLTLQALENEYGKADTVVRSRAGKLANQYVYSSKGFAFSELDGSIEFFKVFPICDLKEYIEHIYIEPPIFTH